MSTNPRRRPGFPLPAGSPSPAPFCALRPAFRQVPLEGSCRAKMGRSSWCVDNPVQLDLSEFRDRLIARRRELPKLVDSSAERSEAASQSTRQEWADFHAWTPCRTSRSEEHTSELQSLMRL